MNESHLQSKNILVIEDDASLRSAIETFLLRLKYKVTSYRDAQSALPRIEKGPCDLILSDVMMPGLSGYDLLRRVNTLSEPVPLILMTAYGTIEKAVTAMKSGAYDFLVKPFSLQVLEVAVQSAFLDRQQKGKDDSPKPLQDAPGDSSQKQFFTQNPRMLEIIEDIKKVAPSRATVLIQGESGTGKELLAHLVHEFSPRSIRSFVAINCAAMPDNLLESELFGHERGAFTGAVSQQIGKFEISNNGTILLDEISEMSLTMQTKLLRVLQECEIYRLGGTKSVPLNLRVLATTNRNLYEYMKQGHFREDLYYRINVVPVMVPPLRERGQDALILAEKFLEEFSKSHGTELIKMTVSARNKIGSYPWYGNVRELRNAMERIVLVGNFGRLDETERVRGGNTPGEEQEPSTQTMTISGMERKMIEQAILNNKGNRTQAAKQLGISLRTLRNKLAIYENEEANITGKEKTP